MPGLARHLEAAGIPTVLITPMPYWAEKVGVPRTLAVEHPFGQVLGPPGDVALQRSVLQAALELLTTAVAPATQADHPNRWSIEAATAQRQWQPAEPSPIIAHITPRFRELLRQKRRSDRTL